jgi:hypothetical protein
MTRSTTAALVSAAVSGLLGNSLALAMPAAQGAAAAAPHGDTADAGAKHACKGQNACKGQGGCKTDKHACKGQNACKGQGGCRTDGK